MAQPVCAIVGAGEGLGRALAGKFASRGFDTALVSRSKDSSAAAFEAAAAGGVNVRHFSADAARPDTITAALAEVAGAMGDIEILIYNVRGEFTACEPLDMTCGMLDEIHRIEVVGAFAAAKSVLPAMIGRMRGSVFFSSATAAFRGSQTIPSIPSASSGCGPCRRAWPRPTPSMASISCTSDWTAILTSRTCARFRGTDVTPVSPGQP